MKLFQPRAISATIGGSRIPYIFPCSFLDETRRFLDPRGVGVSRKLILKAAVAGLAFFICAVPISAQRRARARTTTTPPAPVRRDNATPEIKRTPDASVESADVSITATVRARELTFEVVPNPTVEFPGRHERETVWDAVRENLPPAVQPGVTYRDIGIRLKIVSRFADIDRIVAEALGEVPVTDQAPPPDDAQPSAPAPPAPTPQPNGGTPR